MKSGYTNDAVSLMITMSTLKRKLASYPAELVAETHIYGYIIRGYRKDSFRVASYDAETGVLTVANPET